MPGGSEKGLGGTVIKKMICGQLDKASFCIMAVMMQNMHFLRERSDVQSIFGHVEHTVPTMVVINGVEQPETQKGAAEYLQKQAFGLNMLNRVCTSFISSHAILAKRLHNNLIEKHPAFRELVRKDDERFSSVKDTVKSIFDISVGPGTYDSVYEVLWEKIQDIIAKKMEYTDNQGFLDYVTNRMSQEWRRSLSELAIKQACDSLMASMKDLVNDIKNTNAGSVAAEERRRLCSELCEREAQSRISKAIKDALLGSSEMSRIKKQIEDAVACLTRTGALTKEEIERVTGSTCVASSWEENVHTVHECFYVEYRRTFAKRGYAEAFYAPLRRGVRLPSSKRLSPLLPPLLKQRSCLKEQVLVNF